MSEILPKNKVTDSPDETPSMSEIHNNKENELKTLKEELKNKFSHIVFQAEEHQYFNEVGEEYRSVSSVLGEFSAPFDRDGASIGVSKRDRKPVNEIKQTWDIRRDYAIVRGTEFHLYAETFLNGGRKIETVTPIQSEIDAFHLFWDQRNQDRYTVVATELIVADDELKIAGTIDCILQHNETKNFFIFDWKTNRSIRESNKYKTKMAKPINHLEDCELNKYSLQMGFYGHILRKNTTIDIKKSFLIHLSPEQQDKNKSPDPYKVFESKSVEKEIELILNELENKK